MKKASAHILLVDDNPKGIEFLEIRLKSLGHRTTLAHNGEVAIAIVERDKPDVVVLDVTMPEVNGYQACRAMRAGGLDAIFVAMTGYSQEEDRRKSREAGFHHHLAKPVDPMVLQSLLAQMGMGGE